MEGERFGLSVDHPVKQVKSGDRIDFIRELISSTSRGIIGLPIEGSVGLDIRFKEDAAVVIVSKEPPHPEDTKQMVARGARSFNGYEGYLLYVGDREMESIMAKEQMKE
jgi:hypothetical protein